VTADDLELEQFATNILESLKSQLSVKSGANSALLSFTNGEHITFDLLSGKNTTDKIKVHVQFSGKISVEASRNAKKVNISHEFGGLAALHINETTSDDDSLQSAEEPQVDTAMNEVSQFLEPARQQYEREQANLADDEVGVLLVHGAKTGVDVHAGKRHEDAGIRGGFIVGAKTKVTKA